MKNLKKISASVVGAMAFAVPFVTSAADIWGTASSTEQLNLVFVALGVIFAVVIAAVLGAWASLHGLGFGLRKVSRYITGRRF